VELTGDEKAARAQLRIEALERELVQRQDVVNRALQAHNDMRQRQAELLKDFEDEKQTTFAITADMTRQYKSMQEELMRRINTLESTIMEQKDQLELARQACSSCPKCSCCACPAAGDNVHAISIRRVVWEHSRLAGNAMCAQ